MSSDLMRLAGINSGYDTEAMIEKLMTSYQSKIDTQNKKLQKLTWQQEAYRDITSKITEFKNKYFDILKRDTYLMSPSSFSQYKTNITTKSGKVSGLKATASKDAIPGTHTIKVNGLATAAVTKGGQFSTANFKLDVDRAIKDAKADSATGEYNFSLDVKVGNVARTIEFSGSDKDELLANLNSELEDAFGKTSSGKAFISASMNSNGEFAFETSGNAIATVTERTGNFGMGKPATKLAINLSQALTGQSSVSVSIPNYYTHNDVTKNITFSTVSSTYFDSISDPNIKAAYTNLKKMAYSERTGIAYAQVTEQMMDDAKFSYSSAEAAADLNQQSLLNALNSAYGMEQGISFSINGSYISAKYMQNGSAAEFTMTSTCESTLGLKKGSASSYIDESMKISDLGIVQSTKVVPTETKLPEGFSLNITKAIEKADPDENGVYSFALDVTFNGVSQTVNFSGKDTDEIMKDLNKSLADALGKGKIVASKYTDDNNNEKLSFTMYGAGDITMTENTGNFGLYLETDKVAFNPGDTFNVDYHWLSVIRSENGKTTTTGISMGSLSSPEDFDDPTDSAFLDLKEAAFRKANGLSDSDEIDQDAFDAYTYTAMDAAADTNVDTIIDTLNVQLSSWGYTFEYADGILSAKNEAGESLVFAVDSEDGNFGAVSGSASASVKEETVEADNYFMTINGKTIEVDKNATVSDLMNAVNKSDAGVTMTYSKLEGAFKLTANDKGAGADIRVDNDNALAQALKLTDDTMASHTDGTNATITIDGIEVEHNDNVYELDGITFDFADVDPTENDTITVNVEKSYDDIKAAIKSFVEDYNKLIDDVYGYIDTAPKRDKDNNLYEPLTDEQKEDMSEKEIENWEKAAKTGILYNDNTVYSVMTKLRSALTTSITLEDGTKFSLASMGIKTVSLLDGDFESMKRGKLQLDEDRLDKVLNEKPEYVVELFTGKDGVMSKTNTALDSAVKSAALRKNQGTLIRKAGLEKGTSAKDNAIYKEMERINKRIETLKERYQKKEDYWWSVFTNLEKMMANMNSQMSYMASYLTTNNTTNTQ